MPEDALFWAKVNKHGPTMDPLLGPCWEWIGSRTPKGYGKLLRRIDGVAKTILAHRYAYELEHGPIPDGLPLDHKCRNHPCIRPDHLEPVTTAVNTARGISPAAQNAKKDLCKRGHVLDYRGNGTRYCRTCHADQQRERRNR